MKYRLTQYANPNEDGKAQDSKVIGEYDTRETADRQLTIEEYGCPSRDDLWYWIEPIPVTKDDIYSFIPKDDNVVFDKAQVEVDKDRQVIIYTGYYIQKEI